MAKEGEGERMVTGWVGTRKVFFLGGGGLHRDERREGGIVRKVTCSLLILNLMKYASLG